MRLSLKKEKAFLDPILGLIHVNDPIILKLINSHEMQRLRRIKHLGVANIVFHGGEQSRFQHSLGVYEISCRMLEALKKNSFNLKKTDKNDLLVKASALLHDIGHGAYSHTFEHLFNTNHEKFSQKIILDPNTEVNKILKEVSNDFPKKVASVIAKTYPNKRIVQMISSQLDADRMDYLLRDAYYTGTEYGRYDIERILRLMIPIKDGFAFNISGLHSIEDYVISRYQMYSQVYFHPVSRGMQVLLENLMKRARKIYKQKKENKLFLDLIKPLFDKGNKLSINEYLSLDDSVFNTAINIWQHANDKILSSLSKGFLDRKPFKSIILNNYSRKYLDFFKTEITKFGFNKDYYTGEDDATDLPYESYFPKSYKGGIMFIYPDGTKKELSQLSPLVSAINNKRSIDKRFFFPKEILANPKVNKIYIKFKSPYLY